MEFDLKKSSQIQHVEAQYIDTCNIPDRVICHMFLDAMEANVPIRFEPKPIFKPNMKKPMIDTLDANKEVVMRLLYET